VEQEQPKAQSQETKMSNNNDQHSEDKSMIVPPSIQTTTTPPTEPYTKRPCRTDKKEDPQATLTQIWSPRPTQVLDFKAEANDKQQGNESDITEAVKNIVGNLQRLLTGTHSPNNKGHQW
jgi:hypothetical protein